MANSTMVANCYENVNPRPTGTSQEKRNALPTQQANYNPSPTGEAGVTPMSCIGEHFKGQGLSEKATLLVMSSWRNSTKKQYNPYINRWEQYCHKREIDPFSAPVEEGVNFLAELYDSGVGYSAINTARSALSTCIQTPGHKNFGSHPLVCRVLKGVFESRPSLPKYSSTWDAKHVLDYLRNLHPAETLTLKDLTHKLVMLMALLSGQRRQTLHSFKVSDMHLSSEKCTFVLKTLLKTSRPGRHLSTVEFLAYHPDNRLCVVTYMFEYLKRTSGLRQSNKDQLLITYQKPHKPASADTISRWIKHVLDKAGVNTSVFSAHSTRAAATSRAKTGNVPLETIMKSAGWSSENTFQKFYNMPIVNSGNFGNELLEVCDSHK